MKSYTFKVVLEKDKWPDQPDKEAIWRAWVPALEARGAHAWGDTEEQALDNLRNALDLVLEHLEEQGEAIPKEAAVVDELLVTVTR